MIFDYAFTVRASLAAVADFHHDARALKLLSPPPIVAQLHLVEPMANGSIAEFTLWFGPLPVRWRAVHSNVVPQRGFTDTQARGPLRAWQHTHTFDEVSGGVRVHEHVEYEHDSGWRGVLSRLLFNAPALGFLFWYRGWATRRALEK
ncbi:MAG: hypothetical protein DWG81_02565 [Chloroflexi bacterium]|nr:hypothetical protein [Chloroflexota bacterium]